MPTKEVWEHSNTEGKRYANNSKAEEWSCGRTATMTGANRSLHTA